MNLALKSAEIEDSEREELRLKILGQKEALDDTRLGLRLIVRHATGATRSSFENCLKNEETPAHRRLLRGLEEEFPAWTRSLRIVTERFDGWLRAQAGVLPFPRWRGSGPSLDRLMSSLSRANPVRLDDKFKNRHGSIGWQNHFFILLSTMVPRSGEASPSGYGPNLS